ncbi:MAG: tRNA pseudouridine(55) synthase TruB [Thermomicrobiales bacterium]
MARRDDPHFHGFLIVDKPAGMTSHDVVSRVRRLCGQRTVGHAGTLDPAATGVLPVALGAATRMLAFAGDSSKTYRAEITFGVETDSFDADGVTTRITNESPSLSVIEELVPRYVGRLTQTPPMHSAIQIGGRRLYDLARAGVVIDPPARPVVIHQIEILDYRSPTLTICVDCGSGTYIRSLARDIGRDAGTGAYLSDLVRLRSGGFSLADAWTFAELSAMPLEEAWPVIAYHPDRVIDHLPAAILDHATMNRWRQGQPSRLPIDTSKGFVRTYSERGDWLGIGEIREFGDSISLWPKRVIDQSQFDSPWWGQR